MMKRIIFFCFMLSTLAIQAQDRLTGQTFATRSEVIATHGMACTSQPLATQVALDILKSGGNAIDAPYFCRYPNVADVYMPGGEVPGKGEVF